VKQTLTKFAIPAILNRTDGFESGRMNISLTPSLEALVQEKVTSGFYNNASEVVRFAS
jgi:hypothetical protein